MAYGLADYERDAEDYCEAAGRAWRQYRTGRVPAPDLQALMDDWGFLFGRDLIEQLAQEPTAPNRRAALVAFAVDGHLTGASRRPLVALLHGLATVAVPWEQQAVPYRAVATRLANLADVQRRHDLDRARREAEAELDPPRRALHEARITAATRLGATDLLQLAETRLGVPFDDVAKLADWLLGETEAQYREALDVALRLAGIERGDAWAADLGWLTRAARDDAAFPARDLTATTRRALLWLGLRLEEQAAIQLDVLPVEQVGGSSVTAISVPHELAVVLAPRGGWRDQAALLGLLGRAEHLANVDPALPMPFRWLGDPAIGLGYGALLAGLIRDPHWLAAVTGMATSADLREYTQLDWLIRLRRDAALVGQVGRIYRDIPGEWEELAERYVDAMGAALGVQCHAEDALRGAEVPFAPIQRLRGALFGEQLRAYLVREYDEEWFRAPRAGRFLVELWREGTRYSAAELLQFMGYAGFDATPLRRAIRAPAEGAA